MSKKAEVLIQLLEKVPDSNKLQRLLEPDNLLYLLQQYGYHKEDLQQRLQSDTLPGELLLELLDKEPDSEYLLVMLNNTMDTKVEKRVVIDEIIRQKKEEKAAAARATSGSPIPPTSNQAARSVTSPAPQLNFPASTAPTPTQQSSIFERPSTTFAIGIITLTSIIPALTMAGFFVDLRLPQELVFAIAFIGGAVAGALFAHYNELPRWKCILIGIVLNVGILLVTIVYAQMRDSLLRIEIVIPLLLGSLPALLLFALLFRKNQH